MADGELMQLALMAYEAGSEPSLWQAFLEAYARLTSADVSLIQVHRYPQHCSEIIVSHGLKTRLRDDYNNYYSRINVWRENGRTVYRQNNVVLDAEVYPRELLKKSEFFNDCLRAVGGVYSMAGVIARDPDNTLVLTTLRGEQGNSWEVSDKRMVEFLLPHVRRACLAQQKLAIFRAEEMVLDSFPVGIVLFTAGERSIYVNRTAESIFQNNDGLLLRGGVLASDDSTTNALIQRSIRSAARMDVPMEATEAVLVNRKSMRSPYQLVVLPVRRRFSQFAGVAMPAVLVLITDPERETPAPPQLIRKLYGLTAKEAELVTKLASGVSPNDAAQELGMRYETARTHLKHIYSKMGVSRQSELVALVGRLSKLPPD
jgi:DNA-binding CsgD family transcriptional regulator